MASTYLKQFIKHFHDEIAAIDGYVALDGSSNVVAAFPALTMPLSGKAYTYLKGCALPVHTSTGTYTITLSKPWIALLDWNVKIDSDGYNVTNLLTSLGGANVTGTQSSSPTTGTFTFQGNLPGTDPSIAPQTIILRFTTAAGVLTDPPANKGFHVHLLLKQGTNI